MNGSDFSRLGDGLHRLICVLFLLNVLCVPLAIWKLLDISKWLFNHVDLVIK